MIDFWKIKTKHIKITGTDKTVWVGRVVDRIPADENDEGKSSIVIIPDKGYKYSGQQVEFYEDEILSIETVDL